MNITNIGKISNKTNYRYIIVVLQFNLYVLTSLALHDRYFINITTVEMKCMRRRIGITTIRVGCEKVRDEIGQNKILDYLVEVLV